ncbi:MAG: 30S ribosomal protein S12 methylthiotransferase RimO [Nitrospiraceae bacterium]|jgi:ribosomal protein S12 methylthiotransferase|nr:30S ribosomal protein S12 methylthiotransferase RimO [Nitrospiraceae bacterium]
MTTLAIHTLGCPKNITDSRHLAERLAAEGLAVIDDQEKADILLVNTCGFIQDAKEESIEEILKFSQAKKPEQTLVVFGCLAQRYRKELKKEIPEIAALFGVGEADAIVAYCRAHAIPAGASAVGAGAAQLYEELRFSELWQPSYTYLKISDGCNKRCTFCIIPAIRGKFHSLPSGPIIDEARAFVERGTKELILVAQDISNYGREFKDYGLVSLLKELVAIPGDFRIRLLYLYPTEISEELLAFVAAEEKILKYLDIPLQHSEDRILRAMGRRGTRKEYTKLIRTIRRMIPGVTLRTSFIVGFPGETEQDFQGMVDFIEEIRFDRLGVFKYSREDGTPAAKLPGQVTQKTKDRRFDEIMKRQALISLEKNRELVGKRMRAVVDEVDDEVIIARLDSQAPEIDGVVIVERPKAKAHGSSDGKRVQKPALPSGKLLKLASTELRAGSVIEVLITGAFDYDLKGELAAVLNR